MLLLMMILGILLMLPLSNAAKNDARYFSEGDNLKIPDGHVWKKQDNLSMLQCGMWAGQQSSLMFGLSTNGSKITCSLTDPLKLGPRLQDLISSSDENDAVYTHELKEIDFSLATLDHSATSIWKSYYPKYAFLHEATKFYHTLEAPPVALWFGFVIPVPVVKFSFQSGSEWNTDTDGPSKYTFFGSNSNDCSDKSSWITLVEDNSGTPFADDNTPKTEVVPGNDSYTCYGINVLEVPGRLLGIKFVMVQNIKLYTTGLQELDLHKVGPKASSTHGPNFVPENGFGISDLYWASKDSLPQSIWYQFPIPVVAAKYSFRTRNGESGYLNQGPSSYEFFGSNASDCSDQTSWITLVQDNSNQPFTTDNVPKSGYIPNPRPFVCYGIKVMNTPMGDIASISSIRIYTSRNEK